MPDYIITAFNRYCDENGFLENPNDQSYYISLQYWLKDHGCEYDYLDSDDPPIWESESKKVEFCLRWA